MNIFIDKHIHIRWQTHSYPVPDTNLSTYCLACEKVGTGARVRNAEYFGAVAPQYA